jgi:hypothetical protein
MSGMLVKPWDERSKRILDQLSRDRIAYIDDPKIPPNFGRRYPGLFDKKNGFADIGNIWRRKESVLVLRPNIEIMPIPKLNKYRFFYKF